MSQPLSPAELNERIETLLNANNFGLSFWHTSTEPPLVLTYQFETAAAADFPWASGPVVVSLLEAFPETYKQVVRNALAEYADVINVQFQEASGNPDADISFYRFGAGPAGTRGLGHFLPPSGDDWDGFAAYSVSQDLNNAINYRRVLHEIGHSLGLKHPGNYDVTGGGAAGPYLPFPEDNNKYTLMSYTRNPDSNAPVDRHLMLYDIASLQLWWGANLSTRVGDDAYTASRDSLLRAIWDAAGTDAIVYGGSEDAFIDLRAGAFSSLGATDNLAIAYGVTIENGIGGGGNDSFVGNAANNVFDGGGGADRVFYDGPRSGYRISTALDGASILITDIDPSNGDAGTDTLRNMEWARFGAEDVSLNGPFPPETNWTAEVEDIRTVAATWQYFVQLVPSAQGFEYLIKSASNPTDLNDPYFQNFSMENRYIAFASNLAFEATAAAWFEQAYGDLTYAEAVNKAYEDIVTSAAATARGIDPEQAKAFFTAGQSYFEAVAVERLVRPGIALDDAVKLALIASVLNEAVRADIGPYATAVNDFADVVAATETSPHFGQSLFDTA